MLTEEYVLSFDHISLDGRYIFIKRFTLDAGGIVKINIDDATSCR